MKIQWILAMVLCLLAVGARAGEAEYVARVYTNKAGAMLPYRLLIPENYQPGKKYPLVLFLHGAGERGNNNQAQLVHGAPLFQTPQVRKDFPCFVIAPQCPEGKKWVEIDWAADSGVQPAQPSDPMQLVVELLLHLPQEFSIDAQRVYVTGLSMGGFGTWDLITRYPNRFAAAAPICGGGDANVAAKAVKTPIWAFHSSDDPVVKVIRSRAMIDALRQAGGKPRYTEYEGLGHFSWGKAYSEPELLTWMFSQRLPKRASFPVKGASAL